MARIKNLKMTIYGAIAEIGPGVGFRDAIYWTVRKMYIGGFMMNEPDGTVYIEAEGDEV